jgi:AraC-like DNA-binding protein
MEASIAHVPFAPDAPAHTPTLGVAIASELIRRGVLCRPGADAFLARIIDTADAMQRPTVEAVCRRLQTSRRTLARRCQALGLPGPARLILLGRLVRAVRIIRRGATCTAAALATGWSDVFTFSNAMYRECRMRPSTFRHDPRAEWHHLLGGWIACHRGDIAIGPAGYTRREALRIALHSAFAALMATPEPGRTMDLTTHSLCREAAARLRPFVGRV